jgi:uncharacterized protein (DUF1800 family)
MTVALLAGSPIQAQSQPLADDSAAALWRAQSRLGYGPAPGQGSPVAPASALAWAQRQLDDAVLASRQPARVPATLPTMQLDMQGLAREVFAERERLRNNRAAGAAAGMPAAGTAGGMAIGTAIETLRMAAATAATAAGAAGAAGTAGATNAARMNPADTPTGDLDRFSREATRDALVWRVMACGNPQFEQALLAKMTEFWFNHFNVFVGKGSVRPFVGHYVLTLRSHAFGRFEDLLLATATHPAMLQYLDQAQSTSRGLNENYARELMELHTLGVNGGYTQTDVRSLARMLTGWSIALNEGEGFRFRRFAHEDGPKSLLGQPFDQRGQEQGIAAIRFLARHPATAQRIATRLASFFVADQPPPALVKVLAERFLQTQGDIHAVLHTLIARPEFWDSQQQLFKTPLDFACSALTATGGLQAAEDARNVLGFLAGTGQAMHGWQTPDGYKTDASTWLAPEALTRRADFAFNLARQASEPVHLAGFASAGTRERVGREPDPRLRTMLWLAGPDFMLK